MFNRGCAGLTSPPSTVGCVAPPTDGRKVFVRIRSKMIRKSINMCHGKMSLLR
jgi:hypothetical protein